MSYGDTTVKPGSIRVAIYKSIKPGKPKKFWAACECGWSSPESTDVAKPSDSAVYHLIECGEAR